MLGLILVRVDRGVLTSGRIVETEAYRGRDDPASHAYRGKTARTEVMFGEAGHAYVYFTYGNHYCLNVTTEEEGEPGAVLIRAIEPIKGIERMRERRGVKEDTDLTNGPGKLTKALSIGPSLYGEDMVTSRRLYLLTGRPVGLVSVSARIGLSQARETMWRYFVEGNSFVSHGRTHNYRKGGSGRKAGSSASLVQASSLG
jgi:DNA-3-methyladenine glycosylase